MDRREFLSTSAAAASLLSGIVPFDRPDNGQKFRVTDGKMVIRATDPITITTIHATAKDIGSVSVEHNGSPFATFWLSVTADIQYCFPQDGLKLCIGDTFTVRADPVAGVLFSVHGYSEKNAYWWTSTGHYSSIPTGR